MADENILKRDQNHVPSAGFESTTNPGRVLPGKIDEVTGRVLVDAAGGGSGTVTSVDVTVPTGLVVTGVPITTSGAAAIALDTGYVIPTQATLDGKANVALSNLSSVAINTNLLPGSNDGAALGSATLSFADLFLASGGVINFANGDVTITHSTNVLAFAGASTRYSFATGAVVPASNDGSALGNTTLQWSDLFLAEGGVINWDNGDVTLTQTGDVLAVAGGDLRVATAGVGTNADSVPTLSSTSTLTNKTLTTPAITAPTNTYTVEPGTDDTAYGDLIAGILAGDTIAQWDLVYLDATSGRWEFADADAAATAGGVLLGLATTSGTDGGALTVLVKGIVRNDGWTWATVGGALFPSTTAGAMTQTAASATDDVVRVLGYATSDDSVWFDPAKSWITLQ